MSELRDLYQEVILDHYKRPRNCGRLECPDSEAEGRNPLCGDHVHVYLKITGGVVEEITFAGEGCAICTASCSLMTEAVRGKTVAEAAELFDGFHQMLTGVAEAEGVELGKLRVFEGVREYPVRIKCATLAWHTLKTAIQGGGAPVTTEK
jgi:nitrogen fixation NifU-like protein